MKGLALIFLSLISLTLNATELFDNPISSETTVVVKKIFKDISEYKIVRSKFNQEKYLYKFKRSLKSSGIFIFDSSKGIAWDSKTPFPSTTIFTQDSMIQKSPNGSKREMSAKGNESFYRFSKTIQAVFLGDFDLIFKEYEIFYTPGIDNKWRLGLIPRDSSLKKIVAAIEIEGSGFIDTFKLHEDNKDYVLYNFFDIEFPTMLLDVDSSVFK